MTWVIPVLDFCALFTAMAVTRLKIAAEPDQFDRGWFTRERILTSLLAAVTLLLVFLCFLLLSPFLPALTFALTIAVGTQVPYRWLCRRFNNKSVTAALSVIIVIVLLVIPAVLLLSHGLQIGSETISSVTEDKNFSFTQIFQSNEYTAKIYNFFQSKLRIEEQLRSLSGAIAGQAAAILTSSLYILTQMVIMLFVLYFIYREGEKAIYVFTKLIPLSSAEASSLVSRINDTLVATVNGTFLVALVQSLLATMIYVLLDIPAALFWGVLTFFTAIVPVFGTFVIWGPISVYLLLAGSSVKALLLLAYGILAIATVDNILYPYMVGGRMRLHTVATFFAVLGGMSLFGASGLVLGPVIVAVTFALLDVWWRRTVEGKAAENEIDNSRAGEREVRPAELLES